MPFLDLVPTYAANGYELVQAYGDFWRGLKRLIQHPVTPETLTVRPQQVVEGETLRLDFGQDGGPLGILGVSGRGAGKANTLDIYVSGTQIVGRTTGEDGAPLWTVLRAEFSLLYLNALEKAEVKRAWRNETRGVSTAYAGYRFVANAIDPVMRHYPDCHASYCLDALEEGAISRRYIEEDAGWKARAGHGQPHVPSAPMDLGGLLYVLLHSHCTTLVTNGWPKDLREVVDRLPSFRLSEDGRSFCTNWYEHSHRAPLVVAKAALRNQPDDFEVPESAKKAGWGARIAGLERNEDPHLTINHHDERSWRLNLRTGKMMPGSDKSLIPDELLSAIEETKAGWCALWDEHYPLNRIGERTW